MARSVFEAVFTETSWRIQGRSVGTFNVQNVFTPITVSPGKLVTMDAKELSYSFSQTKSLARGNLDELDGLKLVLEALTTEESIQSLAKDYHESIESLNVMNTELDDRVRELLNGVKAGQILEGSCNWCPAKPQKPA